MTSKEAIKILNEQRNKFMDEWVDFGGVNEAYNMAIQALKEQEAVVRCKDCKHKEESVSPSWEAWCNRLHCGCDLEWFCADGEKADT